LFEFIIFNGIFAAGHGILAFAMFEYPGPGGDTLMVPAQLFWERQGFWEALAGLSFYHFVSYLVHFIHGDEYKYKTEDSLYKEPWGRLIALHLGLIGGGWLILGMGEPLFALILLVVLKIIVDFALHHHSHQPTKTKEE
jgi:hypothetical protein